MKGWMIVMLALSGMDYAQMYCLCLPSMLCMQLCGMKTMDYRLTPVVCFMCADSCGKYREGKEDAFHNDGIWKSYMTFNGCCVFTC